MINEEHKFIYIHPPKTGGTSIEKLFIPDADKTDVPHKHKYAEFFWQPQYSDWYRFGTVRNPWDRMVSYYCWRIKKNLPMFGKKNFEEWMEFITNPSEYSQYQESNWHFVTAIDTQHKMLFNIENIVRFEHFQEDFDKVCEDIGLPQMELPHVNKSDRGSYQKFYNAHTKGLVAKAYEMDINRFKYSF